ncbi:protein PAXX [Astyanax mexicanus]|uniref:Protein PAXX n=1 Tax=Astyanax mexicanus TaxID=7994 RepID=A0A8T2KTG2_ASTMX|nr:protein PAXX [Astyanax mexicanus]KAG9261959.1 protein PAXX [Astyanax mexicanus]
MDQTDSQPKTVLGTLIDRKDRSKYVCFTQRRAGGLSVGLSNGEDVWKADVSEESLSQMKKSFSLKSTEDYALKLKGACRSGSAFVSLQEDGAVLHLDSEPADLNVSLSKLTDLEGRSELKDLLFKMADSLTQLDAAGATPTSSPIKSLQKKGTGFEPRKQQSSGPTVAVRKRLPGDSIINPGTRRKRAATGVDFDDGDAA